MNGFPYLVHFGPERVDVLWVIGPVNKPVQFDQDFRQAWLAAVVELKDKDVEKDEPEFMDAVIKNLVGWVVELQLIAPIFDATVDQ